MAELSKETQAIIDRLKAEGDLIRNSGTNSVKSVRVQLDRFEGVFNCINNSMLEQVDLMKTQLGIQTEAQERARTQEQLDELNNQRNTNSEQNQAAQRPLSEVGESFGNAIADFLSLKNIAMIGAAGFVGYNLLKGFIDERGGLSQALEDMGVKFPEFDTEQAKKDWEEFKTNVSDLNKNVSGIVTFFGNVNTKLKEFADNPLSIFGLGLGVGALFGLGKDIGGADSQDTKDAKSRLKGIRSKLLFGTVGLALIAGDEIANYIGEMTLGDNWQDTTLGQFGILAGSTAEGALIGYTIGKFFGPYGALAGAVIGAGLGFGNALKNYLDKKNAESEKKFLDRFDEIEQIIKDVDYELSDEEHAELERLAAESVKRIRLATSDAARKTLVNAQKTIENRLLQEVDKKEVSSLGRLDDFDSEERAAFRQYFETMSDGERTFDTEGLSKIAQVYARQYDEGTTGAFGWLNKMVWGERDEFIARALSAGLEKYFVQIGEDGVQSSYIDPRNRQGLRDFLNNQLETDLKFLTIGNSRRGSVSERLNSGGGQGVETGNRMLSQDALSRIQRNTAISSQAADIVAYLASQGALGGTTIIQGGTTVSSPVSMVDGGNQVSMNSYGFGEAGRATNNPMGIPGVTSGIVQ